MIETFFEALVAELLSSSLACSRRLSFAGWLMMAGSDGNVMSPRYTDTILALYEAERLRPSRWWLLETS
jgi:hypothetical protein